MAVSPIHANSLLEIVTLRLYLQSQRATGMEMTLAKYHLLLEKIGANYAAALHFTWTLFQDMYRRVGKTPTVATLAHPPCTGVAAGG
jgi:hypothetical protein